MLLVYACAVLVLVALLFRNDSAYHAVLVPVGSFLSRKLTRRRSTHIAATLRCGRIVGRRLAVWMRHYGIRWNSIVSRLLRSSQPVGRIDDSDEEEEDTETARVAGHGSRSNGKSSGGGGKKGKKKQNKQQQQQQQHSHFIEAHQRDVDPDPQATDEGGGALLDSPPNEEEEETSVAAALPTASTGSGTKLKKKKKKSTQAQTQAQTDLDTIVAAPSLPSLKLVSTSPLLRPTTPISPPLLSDGSLSSPSRSRTLFAHKDSPVAAAGGRKTPLPLVFPHMLAQGPGSDVHVVPVTKPSEVEIAHAAKTRSVQPHSSAAIHLLTFGSQSSAKNIAQVEAEERKRPMAVRTSAKPSAVAAPKSQPLAAIPAGKSAWANKLILREDTSSASSSLNSSATTTTTSSPSASPMPRDAAAAPKHCQDDAWTAHSAMSSGHKRRGASRGGGGGGAGSNHRTPSASPLASSPSASPPSSSASSARQSPVPADSASGDGLVFNRRNGAHIARMQANLPIVHANNQHNSNLNHNHNHHAASVNGGHGLSRSASAPFRHANGSDPARPAIHHPNPSNAPLHLARHPAATGRGQMRPQAAPFVQGELHRSGSGSGSRHAYSRHALAHFQQQSMLYQSDELQQQQQQQHQHAHSYIDPNEPALPGYPSSLFHSAETHNHAAAASVSLCRPHSFSDSTFSFGTGTAGGHDDTSTLDLISRIPSLIDAAAAPDGSDSIDSLFHSHSHSHSQHQHQSRDHVPPASHSVYTHSFQQGTSPTHAHAHSPLAHEQSLQLNTAAPSLFSFMHSHPATSSGAFGHLMPSPNSAYASVSPHSSQQQHQQQQQQQQSSVHAAASASVAPSSSSSASSSSSSVGGVGVGSGVAPSSSFLHSSFYSSLGLEADPYSRQTSFTYDKEEEAEDLALLSQFNNSTHLHSRRIRGFDTTSPPTSSSALLFAVPPPPLSPAQLGVNTLLSTPPLPSFLSNAHHDDK